MTATEDYDEYPESARPLLEHLDREADRQLSSVAQSTSALTTRAALLISAASIFAALPTEGDDRGMWYAISLILTLASAACGVVALVMKEGEELHVGGTRDALWRTPEIKALNTILNEKLKTLDQDYNHLGLRAKVTNWGFGILLASVATTSFHLLTRF